MIKHVGSRKTCTLGNINQPEDYKLRIWDPHTTSSMRINDTYSWKYNKRNDNEYKIHCSCHHVRTPLLCSNNCIIIFLEWGILVVMIYGKRPSCLNKIIDNIHWTLKWWIAANTVPSNPSTSTIKQKSYPKMPQFTYIMLFLISVYWILKKEKTYA